MLVDNFLSFNSLGGAFITKAFLVLFLVFYTVFALIVFRQIQLMAKALPAPISPFLKFIAIVHIGVTFALLIVVFGGF